MSKGKPWQVDRHIKAVLRHLDYLENKRLCQELITWVRPYREPRLSPHERYRFKNWLWWKYGPECGYCHKAYDWLNGLTIDHIQPISKGGAIRDINNMTLACKGCNRTKGDSWID